MDSENVTKDKKAMVHRGNENTPALLMDTKYEHILLGCQTGEVEKILTRSSKCKNNRGITF